MAVFKLAEFVELVSGLVEHSVVNLFCQPAFANKNVFAIDWSWRRIDFVVDFL